MDKQFLLNQLKSGNYKIEMRSDCECNIDWQFIHNELTPVTNTDCCWKGNVLLIKDKKGNEKIIAEQIAFEPFQEIDSGMSTNEFREMLEKNNLNHIIDDMQFDENKEENESHKNKLEESLIEFIKENKYTTAIYYPRDFANEYDCILVEKGANIDNEDAEIITPEKWVKMYLDEGDAVTQKYIRFNLVKFDEEQKRKYYIDYGTGVGNEWVTGTLEEAKKTAEEGARYTQTDITILLDGEIVACLAWSDCRIDVDDEDIEVVKDFGDFGFYSWN